jgi:glycosyltransferase involved in cell wall biosynthesis
MSVSVIMTCHNEERFIAQAVESVLNQTALHRIGEIIIVNDGSTDGSAAVIAALAEKEPRIVVLTANGVGLPAARNLAIKQAAGDYIAILDGDDFWAADKLERQLTIFDAGCEAGLLYSDYVDFSAQDRSDVLHVRVRRYHAGQKDTLVSYFRHDGPIVPSTLLLRRDLLNDIGLFNESYLVYEDTEFYLRAAERWTFQHVPGALTYKRRHGGNITRRLDALLPTTERITREWAARRSELAPLARRRMARCYAKAGNDCVSQGERCRGLTLLSRALRGNPLFWRIYLYFGLAAIPGSLECRIRRAAKLLFHRNWHGGRPRGAA